MKITIHFAIVIAATLYATAFATSYYVDVNHPAANDSTNPGTEELPFKTIQKGIDVAMPGDTVFVKDGIYQPSNGLVMRRSGTTDSLIVFKTIGNVLVQFPDSLAKGWRWSTLFNSYLLLDGFDFSGSKLPIFIQGSYNQILNCKVHDCLEDGVIIAGGSQNRISNNEIYNTGWNGIYIESRPNDGEKGRADSNLVEYNKCYNIPDHFGINIFPNNTQDQEALAGNIIRYNIIYNCNGGIYLRYFKDGFIYGNLIYNNFNNGIFLHHRNISDPPYPFPSNLKIYNNTLANNTPYYDINNVSFTDVEIKNNIIYQYNNLPPLRIQFTDNTILDYNLYYNSSTMNIIVWGDSSKTLEQIQILGQELNGIRSDPLLSADYKLTSQSPAVDAGENLGTPFNYDLEGNLRGQGSGWDIGAFETLSSAFCRFNVKIFLQGAYNGDSMNTELLNLNLIPKNHPYSESPWNYRGTDSVSVFPEDITDWVLIEIRSSETSKTLVKPAFVKSDGSIVDLNGNTPVTLFNINEGDYFLIVHHRNHLPVMSAYKINISQSPDMFDFTIDHQQAYGSDPMIDLGGGVFGMYAGDTNNSGIITAADKKSINSNFLIQDYLKADTNLSGTVELDDKTTVISNNLKQEYVP